MKILAIIVGKKHDKEIVTAIEKYQKRLKKFCDFTWDYIPTSNVDSECLAIEKRINADDFVLLLDETGQSLNNQQLAETIEEVQNKSTKRLVFIIGGAYGVNYTIISKVSLVMSFSSLVFPHQIMRLLLVEQLYRSYSLLAGSNYHHK